MNIKVGGSIGYKLQIGPYEPVDVNSFIEIVEDIEIDEIEKAQNKIDNILLKDVNRKVELACRNYKNVKEILKKSLSD